MRNKKMIFFVSITEVPPIFATKSQRKCKASGKPTKNTFFVYFPEPKPNFAKALFLFNCCLDLRHVAARDGE